MFWAVTLPSLLVEPKTSIFEPTVKSVEDPVEDIDTGVDYDIKTIVLLTSTNLTLRLFSSLLKISPIIGLYIIPF